MYYYLNVAITIILLIVLTSAAFAIDFLSKRIQKRISPKYLNISIIFILFLLMVSGTYIISLLGSWNFSDTVLLQAYVSLV